MLNPKYLFLESYIKIRRQQKLLDYYFYFMKRGPWVPAKGSNPTARMLLTKFDKNAQAKDTFSE